MTKSKKVNEIAKTYLKYCTEEEAFYGGKATNSFYRIRGFFLKQEDSVVDNVYKFCKEQLVSPYMLTLGQLITYAEEYTKHIRRTKDKEEMKRDLAGVDVSSPYDVTSFLSL